MFSAVLDITSSADKPECPPSARTGEADGAAAAVAFGSRTDVADASPLVVTGTVTIDCIPAAAMGHETSCMKSFSTLAFAGQSSLFCFFGDGGDKVDAKICHIK